VSALEALRAGDLDTSMALVKQDVRKNPRDARLRTFLFQMFCITGEWERALTQLSVTADLDPGALPMAHTYQAVIRCEMLRERVFRGETSPTVLGDPGEWLPLLIEATRLFGQQKFREANTYRESAFEKAPETSGEIDGQVFAWIADADPRLGPVFDVIVQGKYVWVPVDRIRRIQIDPPADLRDQVWMPAYFTWGNGGGAHGFIPTRYQGSSESDDVSVKMSHRTEWRDVGDCAIPIGQRVIVTDVSETALMDVRDLVMTIPAASET
jgi:type VI secretion system protein ImpE